MVFVKSAEGVSSAEIGAKEDLRSRNLCSTDSHDLKIARCDLCLVIVSIPVSDGTGVTEKIS